VPTITFNQWSLLWTYLYSTRPQGNVTNNTGVNLYIYLGAGIDPASSGPGSFTSGGGYSILNVNGTYGFISYSTSYVTLVPGQSWPFDITLSSGNTAYFDVDLYYSTYPGGPLTRLSSL
jgi:hypothetical protein